jgi:hypothetical protein
MSEEVFHALETPGQLKTPVKKFQLTEVRSAINQLRPPPKKPQDITLSQEES